MNLIDVIWDYVGHCFDEEGYIPSEEETSEAIGHELTLDELERIDEITERFMNFHDLTDIEVRWERPKTFKEQLAELEGLRLENKREVS